MIIDRLPFVEVLHFFCTDGPVLMCSKYEHHSRVGGSVRVVCEVAANPFSHSVKWMMDAMGESMATTRHLLISDNNIQLSETVSFTMLNRLFFNVSISLVRRTDFSKFFRLTWEHIPTRFFPFYLNEPIALFLQGCTITFLLIHHEDLYSALRGDYLEAFPDPKRIR